MSILERLPKSFAFPPFYRASGLPDVDIGCGCIGPKTIEPGPDRGYSIVSCDTCHAEIIYNETPEHEYQRTGRTVAIPIG